MKLARFERDGQIRTGIVTESGIIDLASANAPVQHLDDIITGGTAALDQLADIAAKAIPDVDLTTVNLRAPVNPRKFLAIGMNYRAHAEEAEKLGYAAPARQLWFNKQTSAIAGPFDPIEPGVSEQLDYEVELGVVIGARSKYVPAEEALSTIFGYVVLNDVSARDWQAHSPTFTIGKSFDTHGPVGPWIVTADEIPDPQNLGLRCLVNGTVRQSSNTSRMIHSIADQIAYLSSAFTLEPGDLIATGTPEGVGLALDPPCFLEPGDRVRCEIDRIGAIENIVAQPAFPPVAAGRR
nr:fumarylacetoacetate hydrolase family protein [Sphingomonas sp. Y57]